ncbi:GNAT family N-acetyltransferase [Paenibacillus thalictri]|uniref:GNAT family N-acetyltransferase n=2 Tax=Paenibacillus thalictri TaxID=2527873 RepID=A0A4Q9DC96_9BACL|nr:GNAT family N-acetyltransferase [Paenibacillus thalictri]
MEEIIRNLTPEDLEESIMMGSFAFQYDVSESDIEDRKAKMMLNLPHQWGCFLDGRLAAKMAVFDLETWIAGKRFAMGGVAGVATWPEYRRGGMVARMLFRVLEKMKRNGQTISYLHPFEYPFYRKYGWEMLTEYKRYELDASQLPSLPAQEGSVVRPKEPVSVIAGIYEKYASRYSGTLARSGEWWQDRVYNKGKVTTAVYVNPQGDASGYIIYKVKDRIMSIQELVWLDEQAWRGLWKFIANHDSMMDKVKLQAPMDDRLPARLGNPRCKQETVPYFMARIVDVPAFLNEYPFAALSGQEGLTLRIEDSFLPWNNGVFRLDIAGDGTVRAGQAEEDGQDADAVCDIQTLTTMLIGYQRPAFLQMTGKLQTDGRTIELLEWLIPQQTTYLMDYF